MSEEEGSEEFEGEQEEEEGELEEEKSKTEHEVISYVLNWNARV